MRRILNQFNKNNSQKYKEIKQIGQKQIKLIDELEKLNSKTNIAHRVIVITILSIIAFNFLPGLYFVMYIACCRFIIISLDPDSDKTLYPTYGTVLFTWYVLFTLSLYKYEVPIVIDGTYNSQIWDCFNSNKEKILFEKLCGKTLTLFTELSFVFDTPIYIPSIFNYLFELWQGFDESGK